MTSRHGWVLGLGCAAALLLGGCSIEGTIAIESTERMGVDLVFRDAPVASCDDFRQVTERGFAVTTVAGPGVSCHVVGYADREVLALVNVLLTTAGEQLSFGFAPLGFEQLADAPAELLPELTSLDLRVIFPGTVLRSSGTASGNEARFTRDDLLELGGLSAVAQDHPGPPFWTLALGGGLLAGASVQAVDDLPLGTEAPRPDEATALRTSDDDSAWAPPDEQRG